MANLKWCSSSNLLGIEGKVTLTRVEISNKVIKIGRDTISLAWSDDVPNPRRKRATIYYIR